MKTIPVRSMLQVLEQKNFFDVSFGGWVDKHDRENFAHGFWKQRLTQTSSENDSLPNGPQEEGKLWDILSEKNGRRQIHWINYSIIYLKILNEFCSKSSSNCSY